MGNNLGLTDLNCNFLIFGLDYSEFTGIFGNYKCLEDGSWFETETGSLLGNLMVNRDNIKTILGLNHQPFLFVCNHSVSIKDPEILFGIPELNSNYGIDGWIYSWYYDLDKDQWIEAAHFSYDRNSLINYLTVKKNTLLAASFSENFQIVENYVRERLEVQPRKINWEWRLA